MLNYVGKEGVLIKKSTLVTEYSMNLRCGQFDVVCVAEEKEQKWQATRRGLIDGWMDGLKWSTIN